MRSSSSSSLNRTESWQPAHPVMPKIPTLSLSTIHVSLESVPSKHWAVQAGELAADHAVAALADGAIHQPLHRQADVAILQALVFEHPSGQPHPDRGAAQQRR